MPKPTEEQILRILNTVARKWSKRSGGRFEVDELVNQVWLYGYVQKLKDIQLVWIRADHDMKHYMRSVTWWRDRKVKRGTDLRRFLKKETLLDEDLFEKEQLCHLTTGLSRKHKLLLKLLAEGFSLRESSSIVGYTQAWATLEIGKIIKSHLISRYILQRQE